MIQKENIFETENQLQNDSHDKRIIELIKKEEFEKAITEFTRLYQDKLYSLCFRMIGNSETAQDAKQDSLFIIYKKLKSFRGDSSLYTWAYRITLNICLNLRRKQKRSNSKYILSSVTQEKIIEKTSDSSLQPHDLCEKKFHEYLLLKSIQKLPENQRVVMILFHLEEQSINQISEILQITKTAVKSRLNRARRFLKNMIVHTLDKEERIYAKVNILQ